MNKYYSYLSIYNAMDVLADDSYKAKMKSIVNILERTRAYEEAYEVRKVLNSVENVKTMVRDLDNKIDNISNIVRAADKLLNNAITLDEYKVMMYNIKTGMR